MPAVVVLIWNSTDCGAPRAVESPAEDTAERPVLGIAPPDDDEVAVAVDPDGGVHLALRGVGVDLELRRERRPRGAVSTREQTVLAAVLAGALPDDDELAGAPHADGGLVLGADGVGVDLELDAELDAGGVEALGAESSERALILIEIGPGHHEVSSGVDIDRRDGLLVKGVGVDLELGAESNRRLGEERGGAGE